MKGKAPISPVVARVRTIPGLSEEQVRAVQQLIREVSTEVANKAVMDRLKRERRKNEREREEHLDKLDAIEAEFRSQLSKIATYECQEIERDARRLLAERYLAKIAQLQDEEHPGDPDKYAEWRQTMLDHSAGPYT